MDLRTVELLESIRVVLDENTGTALIKHAKRAWSKVKPQEGEAKKTALRLVKAMRSDRQLMDIFHSLKVPDIKYRLKDVTKVLLDPWLKKNGLEDDPEMRKVPKELEKFVPAFRMTEARPGPHWNPWPQKKTSGKKLAQSLIQLAKLSAKHPDSTDWNQKTIDVVANIGFAMNKGDKAAVKKLLPMLIKQGQVAPGLVNEIYHWIRFD